MGLIIMVLSPSYLTAAGETTKMETLELSEIRAWVSELAAKISATSETFPTFGYSEHTGRPHVEVDTRGYHYVVAERGQEYERHTTSDLDELLYRIFADITFTLSLNFELAHRVEDQDCRRIMFQYQVELLARLSSWWAEREAQEHESILEKHPFDDYASLRADYIKSLTDRHFPYKWACKIAYKKYPLPKDR